MRYSEAFRLLLTSVAVAAGLLAATVRADAESSPGVSPNTLAQATAGAAEELLCQTDSAWNRCFPKLATDCRKTLATEVEPCANAERAKMKESSTPEEFSMSMKLTLVCAIERIMSSADALSSEECSTLIAQTKGNLETQRKAGFKPNLEAEVPADMVIRGVSNTLQKVRCDERVLAACFKIDERLCKKILAASIEQCTKTTSAKFPETVTRTQSGELGREMDRCVSRKFLPEVVKDPAGPGAECTAAMRAAW